MKVTKQPEHTLGQLVRHICRKCYMFLMGYYHDWGMKMRDLGTMSWMIIIAKRLALQERRKSPYCKRHSSSVVAQLQKFLMAPDIVVIDTPYPSFEELGVRELGLLPLRCHMRPWLGQGLPVP